jgi:hypothetical protein
MNTNNLLHVNTIFKQGSIHTIFARNTNNITTRVRVQQVTEADWLSRARDSRCAEASKTQPPPFVSRILTHYYYAMARHVLSLATKPQVLAPSLLKPNSERNPETLLSSLPP